MSVNKPVKLDRYDWIGVVFVVAVVVIALWAAYTLFVYMPAHNMDRCAEGFKFAADGFTLCP